MELRNIISFRKICELNSFSKAADEMGYSQSTVTMQIKQLEDELQLKLFDRIGKNIQLTDDGRKFLSYANDIVLTVDNARLALSKDTLPSGEIKIGILESVCTAYLPGILKEFHSSYPKVSTVIKIGTFREMEEWLNSNHIDVLWTYDLPIERKEWNRVFSYENDICIVAAPGNILTANSILSLKDIKNETYILTEKNCSYRTIFEEKVRSLDFNPDIFLEIGNTEIIKKFVKANLGLSVLPEFTVFEELKNASIARLNVTDFNLKMEGQLFIHKNKWITPCINAFIDLVSKKLG